jgi:hypothetical protein
MVACMMDGVEQLAWVLKSGVAVLLPFILGFQTVGKSAFRACGDNP